MGVVLGIGGVGDGGVGEKSPPDLPVRGGGYGGVEGDINPVPVIILHFAVDLIDAGGDADGAGGGYEEDVASGGVGGAAAIDAEGLDAQVLRVLVRDEGDAVTRPGDQLLDAAIFEGGAKRGFVGCQAFAVDAGGAEVGEGDIAG